MRWLPYRALELLSPLSPTEAARALSDSVEPKRWLRMTATKRPFEGTVTDSEFRIQRIIAQNRAFLPQIRGTILPDVSGSRVSFTMRLQLSVALYVVIWVGLVVFLVAPVLRGALAGQMKLVPTLVALGMLLAGWLLPTVSFTFEAGKAERLLATIFRGSVRSVDVAQDKPAGFY